ncbi:RNA 2'-phosphotransferase, partial [bacterium]|nr:RNA 2'-phosphotransferase [bacterium]
MDAVRLSKLLSFVLRHLPDALGLVLDKEGWADLDALVERLNASGRLEASLDKAALVAFVEGEGASRFSVDGGRMRARAGHTAEGVALARPVPATPPEFLFFGAPRERASRWLSSRGLDAESGRSLRLHESERTARRTALGGRRGKARVVVIEAQRASRAGVVFLKGEPGVFLATEIPRRYLLSERPGFERQVSAGAVLVRTKDGQIEIALIRTKPRADSSQESARLFFDRPESGRFSPPAGSSESGRLPLGDASSESGRLPLGDASSESGRLPLGDASS